MEPPLWPGSAPEPEPKAEKKKDVIPGADLEPILVEPEGPELSAEERARLEAEEEEKARREAELVAADEPGAAAGNGKIEINKRSLEEFFPRPLHQTMVEQPLTVSGCRPPHPVPSLRGFSLCRV